MSLESVKGTLTWALTKLVRSKASIDTLMELNKLGGSMAEMTGVQQKWKEGKGGQESQQKTKTRRVRSMVLFTPLAHNFSCGLRAPDRTVTEEKEAAARAACLSRDMLSCTQGFKFAQKKCKGRKMPGVSSFPQPLPHLSPRYALCQIFTHLPFIRIWGSSE